MGQRLQIEFDSEELVRRAVSAVRATPKIEQVEVHFTTDELLVTRGGVRGEAHAVSTERIAYCGRCRICWHTCKGRQS